MSVAAIVQLLEGTFSSLVCKNSFSCLQTVKPQVVGTRPCFNIT